MNRQIADYKHERQIINNCFESEPQKRILMFYGEAGIGKTTLIRYGQERSADKDHCINIDLENCPSVAEMFSRFCLYFDKILNMEDMTHFIQCLASSQDMPQIKIDKNQMTGFINNISVYLNLEHKNDREERYVNLTNAFFSDLHALNELVLFVFDNYDQATTEIKQWVKGSFLARVRSFSRMRVIIAGESVPDEHNIEWGEFCITQKLSGVPDARDWLPLFMEKVHDRNRNYPPDSVLSQLEGLCRMFHGRPSMMMQYYDVYLLDD